MAMSALQTFSTLVARAQLATKMAQQTYSGDRNIYEALGYLEQIDYDDYLARYVRQDIAKAIIDRPAKATWNGDLELLESGDIEDTALETAYKELDEEFRLKLIFSRLDRLTCIGRYGVLLLGLDDVSSPESFANPVAKGNRKLKYLKPFGEASAKLDTYVINPKDPRYGLPLTYNIQVADVESGMDKTVKVHYTRIIHVVGDNLESEVTGAPVLEAVFNRLFDIEKLVGGDAEMFWRGARPGYVGKVDKDYQMTDAMVQDLKDQTDEFEHNMRRLLVNEGVDLSALAQQIADPSSHVDVQLQMICASVGMPKRILVGSERGELSSTQDQGEWLSYVKGRREEFAELKIVRPFVDRCIELGILPAAEDTYIVNWSDLFALSEKERTEIGRNRAMALREYSTNPMSEAVMPPEAFLKYGMGLRDEDVELIEGMLEDAAGEDLVMGGDKMLESETAPPPAPIMTPPTGKTPTRGGTGSTTKPRPGRT